jgi:hypothetical protein
MSRRRIDAEREFIVMAGLDPAFHVLPAAVPKDVDARVKPGHDGYFWGEGRSPQPLESRLTLFHF